MTKIRVGLAVLFILIMALTVSGCATLAEFIPFLASPTVTPTPSPSFTPTSTKTMVTFNRWTNTPEGLKPANLDGTAWASPPIPTQTLRPSWTPLPSKTLRPTWTPSLTLTPSITLTPTPTVEVYRFLNEQFSDSGAAWFNSSGQNWSMGINKGVYEMVVSAPNVPISSSRSWLRLDEVRMEADIKVKEGAGYFGFVCRESNTIYYLLFISTDNHYGLGIAINGKVEFLIYAPSPAIHAHPGSTNHVRAECRGNTISLWANGVFLAREEVEALGVGYAGMLAGTRYDQNYLKVHFDNLQIWGPDTYSIITNTPSPPTETPTPTPEG